MGMAGKTFCMLLVEKGGWGDKRGKRLVMPFLTSTGRSKQEQRISV